MSRGDNLSIFYNHCAKWSAVAVMNTGFSFGNGRFHKFFLIHFGSLWTNYSMFESGVFRSLKKIDTCSVFWKKYFLVGGFAC